MNLSTLSTFVHPSTEFVHPPPGSMETPGWTNRDMDKDRGNQNPEQDDDR